MIPFTVTPTVSPTNATRPKLTDMRGIFRHYGDRQYFMCFYRVALTFLSKDYQSSWLLHGHEGSDTEINLESWEVGQMLGGN